MGIWPGKAVPGNNMDKGLEVGGRMAALRLEIRLQRLESPVVRGRQEMRGRLGTSLLGDFGPYLKSSGNPLKDSYQVFPLKDDLGCCDRKDWRAPQWMQGEQ